MTSQRGVTIMIHRDGALESRQIRLPLWGARLAVGAAVAVAALIMLAAALYAPIARTAASVPGMRREMAHLRAENEQIQQLARTLSEMEARYAQVRRMLGGDVIPPRREETGERLPIAHAVYAASPGRARFESGPSNPTHWPLDERGLITRGQVRAGGSDEAHPGLDIAVPVGTPIRASGGGVVGESGEDDEYGRFVRIDHPDGFQSLYGHASRILVAVGDSVGAGQVIGLSGSTGRSTGPHLHFEVRRDGRSIDPRSLVREES